MDKWRLLMIWKTILKNYKTKKIKKMEKALAAMMLTLLAPVDFLYPCYNIRLDLQLMGRNILRIVKVSEWLENIRIVIWSFSYRLDVLLMIFFIFPELECLDMKCLVLIFLGSSKKKFLLVKSLSQAWSLTIRCLNLRLWKTFSTSATAAQHTSRR